MSQQNDAWLAARAEKIALAASALNLIQISTVASSLSLSLSACLFSFFFGEKIQNSYAQIHTHMMMIDRPVQHFTCVNFVGASSTNKLEQVTTHAQKFYVVPKNKLI